MGKRKKKKLETFPKKVFSFTLHDGSESENKNIRGTVEDNGHTIDILLDGYGTNDTMDNYGAPICLDYFDGKLQVLVWGDINTEEPTHKIDLAGALFSSRQTTKEEIDEAWQEMLKKHMHPSRLFRLAMKMDGAEPTEQEVKHLKECQICGRTYQAYKESI